MTHLPKRAHTPEVGAIAQSPPPTLLQAGAVCDNGDITFGGAPGAAGPRAARWGDNVGA
jgi:hypothetical protein